jgi:ELWxxDGT repeat protein
LEPRTLLSAGLVYDFPESQGSIPLQWTEVSGTMYFVANDQDHGWELWKTDGTSSGTRMVKDINSKAYDEFSDGSAPSCLTNVNGTLYFTADDGERGRELWKSDGTSEGTKLVCDLDPEGSADPRRLTNVAGSLMFIAHDEIHGEELWRSDGTSAGTIRLSDFDLEAPYRLDRLTPVNNELYFTVTQDYSGKEIWKSDGTPEGTNVVAATGLETGWIGFDQVALNGFLYYSMITEGDRWSIMRTDGTPEGTEVVHSLPWDSTKTPLILGAGETQLFFQVTDEERVLELWSIQGTTGEMSPLIDSPIELGEARTGGVIPFRKTIAHDTLYEFIGNGLLKSNGSPEGTSILQGYAADDSRQVLFLENVNDTLFFWRFDDDLAVIEIWQSDGSGMGTQIVKTVFSLTSELRSGALWIPSIYYSFDLDEPYAFHFANDPFGFMAAGNSSMFFPVYDASEGWQVWSASVPATPSDITLSNSVVPENAAKGNLVGVLQTTDANRDDLFSYSLISGPGDADNAWFHLDGNLVRTVERFDFEKKAQYSIRIQTTDRDGLTFSRPFTIDVADLNEAPDSILLSQLSVAENLPAGTTVGTLVSTDPDSRATFTYSLSSGEGDADNVRFFIDGPLLKTAEVLDHEMRESYSIRVRVTDEGGLTFERSFIITGFDVNESPTQLGIDSVSLPENRPAGTSVGSFAAEDPDRGQSFTYELVSGLGDTDNSRFAIVDNTLRSAAVFDHESQASHSIRVRVTDQAGLSFEKQFRILVGDGNDAPSRVVLSNVVTAIEAQTSVLNPIRLADVSLVDDGLGNNQLGLSGSDASLFEIVSGQLRLRAGVVFSDPNRRVLSVTVHVDDVEIGGNPDASTNYNLTLQGYRGMNIQQGAVGRSYIRFIDLNFEASQGLGAIVASLQTAGPRLQLEYTGMTGASSRIRSLAGKVTVVENRLRIDFGVEGIGGNRNSGQGDGNYRILIDLDGDGRYESVASFHRLLGDVDGNGVIDRRDFGIVRESVGRRGVNLMADLNGDGVVTVNERAQVQCRQRLKVFRI